MIVVTKLVNVHFVIGCNKVKWSFQTVYDDISEKHKYNIITGKRTKEVDKDTGNKLFSFIKRHFRDCKAIVVFDNSESGRVECVRVREHFEIYVNGKFAESCDGIKEAREAKQKWIEKLRQK